MVNGVNGMDQFSNNKKAKAEHSEMKLSNITFLTPIRSKSIQTLKYKCNNFVGEIIYIKNFSWYCPECIFFHTKKPKIVIILNAVMIVILKTFFLFISGGKYELP